MIRSTLALFAIAWASPAFAEVKVKAADRLEFAFSGEVSAPATKVWARVVKPGTWWSSAHTYSGKASNLKLTEKAGGCWCEIWAGGQVEHGRVVMLQPNEQLNVDTALGPFQEMGVAGVMVIKLSPGAEGKTKVTLDYRVSGSSTQKLDALAGAVDSVLSEQFASLLKVE
jgi:uncharacterized protein YndB with AHSA1/START domain